MSYIIIEMQTGAWDGLWFIKKHAESTFKSLISQYPKGTWILAEVKKDNGFGFIGKESKWWGNCKGLEGLK